MNFINTIDDKIYMLLFNLQNQFLTGTMLTISFFASTITLIVISIALAFILKEKKYSRFIMLNLLLAFITNRVIKYIVRRQRPGRIQIIEEKGYSFPSGHTMISFAFYGFIIYLIYKNVKNKKIRNISIVLLSLLILLIGISRIYLGVHYVTDVLGGFVFGFIYLVLFIKYLYNKEIKVK